jgi:TnpA family transposase
MHVVGSVPWSIRSDTPRELLFLGYIGRQEGFQAPETAPPASSIEADWQAWWQFLLAHNFDTLGEAVRRDTPGITGIPFLRELGRRLQAVYDPPRFSVLADRPALQTLCQRWSSAPYRRSERRCGRRRSGSRGARRYGNPEQDLPADFEEERTQYYAALRLPSNAEAFVASIRTSLAEALHTLETGLARKRVKGVKVMTTRGGWIQVSPFEPWREPPNLTRLKHDVARRWPMTGLLDILKETALRTEFTSAFTSVATREILDRATLQKRLLLCLYALGTNTGLEAMSNVDPGSAYSDLRYVRRRYISKEQVRIAIAEVANATFRARQRQVWGEGKSACASDSKKFGAWDQNLMTEWSIRHFGRGVLVYWHVEEKSVCVYSQLKSVSSSEVAAMIEGVLRHCTDLDIEKQYVDSHGQREIGFAFCHLLGFRLMPRLKRIGAQRLYRADPGDLQDFPSLRPVLGRPIDWDLIVQQYDQMVKYATALRLGTAEAEAILRRFTRANVQHPTYRALCELGKAVKMIFLCQYLHRRRCAARSMTRST